MVVPVNPLSLESPPAHALTGTCPAHRFGVASVRLSQFRNYADVSLVVQAPMIVLTGPNGAGKTSLLEAVSLLAPGRGLRRAKPLEWHRTAADGTKAAWAMLCRVNGPLAPSNLRLGAEVGERRTLSIDGLPARAQTLLSQHAAVVWLTPAMDDLFRASPGERRRFLDRLVFAYDPAHLTRVNAFEKAMRERAELLRTDRNDGSWLDGVETVMAEQAVAIVAARADTLERLAHELATCDDGERVFSAAGLGLAGTLENYFAQEQTAVRVEDWYRGQLRAARLRDADAGVTTLGPHRADLIVQHGQSGREAAQCSTGEQKALLISIIFSHARILTRERQVPLLLLLDDVVSFLDANRRDALLRRLAGLSAQIWITGTDPNAFVAARTHAQMVSVDGGRLPSL
jgi:DNA replication and repair protein RecF